MMHNRLLTNERRSRLFGGSDGCPFYTNQPESTLHAFRDCRGIALLWSQLINPDATQVFFGSNLEQWVNLNFGRELRRGANHNWMDIFITAC
ncbi:hypothetical protein Ahy_A09g042426 [Arachis hypogaea]|uniref:Reverse transcriptase zinc-binding domain-containing protein n=1 Tax=Arachis hypogaea TaxID=3818 RepID=A0A445BFW6_ARAHY|nr:hypothetical protein Ahy_A09g042426 [Arachis hypogaea]